MHWVSLGALILTSIMCFIAAECARGVRIGRGGAHVSFVAAVVAYVAAVALYVQFGAGEGFARVVALVVPSVAGLACFWHVKEHVDQRASIAGLIAASLGLALFVLVFTVAFGAPVVRAPDAAADPIVTGAPSATDQIARLRTRRQDLERRVRQGIPTFRRALEADALEVRRELNGAAPEAVVRLEDEMREIARLMLALDEETEQSERLISRLAQEERRLDRLIGAEKHLGVDDALLDELDAIWSEAGQRLSAPLDDRLGTGAVQEAALMKKLAELLER